MDLERAPRVDGYQGIPIELTMILGCLRGLEYRIESLMSGTAVDATTYLDIASVQVKHGQDVAEFVEPAGASFIDMALASGANALGFPPRVLDRSSQEDEYKRLGIRNFPQSRHLWYTDGGTLDNEPLGHTLDLVADLDHDVGENVRRLHLLVHPHPTAAPHGDAWADPDVPHTWLATLLRSDHLQRTQSLYDDLRRVEKTNSRLVWLERLDAAIGDALANLDAADRERITSALQATLRSIDADRARLSNRPPASNADGTDNPRALLNEVVSRIAGVGGKQKVALEVISPLVLPDAKTHPVEDLLAGEILNHFGGFFDERMRNSDFDLGYASALEWLRGTALQDHGLDATSAHTAVASAEHAYTPGATWKEWGDKTVGYLARRHPLAIAGLIAQLGRVVTQDVITRHQHAQ